MARQVQGIGVSPGVAMGPVVVVAPPGHLDQPFRTVEEEQEALDRAVAQAVAQLQEIANRLRSAGHGEEAGIMEAQGLMTQDPTLLEAARRWIAERASAGQAISRAGTDFARMLEEVDDPYVRARSADVLDVVQRVRANLSSAPSELRIEEPSVLVAGDLTPSQTASLDRSLILGLATDRGSDTSHTAILARALNIPAVVALGNISSMVRVGQDVALDGEAGTVIIDPNDAQRRDLQQRARRRLEHQGRLRALRDEPALTLDGHRLTLAANIGSPADVAGGLEVGAEGVGLLRTEFLFAGRAEMPSEAEQIEAYRSVLSSFPERLVVIRTLDAGGDKQLPYLPMPEEANPFLGLRGVRFTLAYPDLFRSQLRALMRASSAGRLAIMFPMVSDPAQLDAALALLQSVRAEVGGRAEVGIMVEVPAAALLASHFAPHVSFLSVGSNDLIQYTLAVDRVNEQVASLYAPLHPAVLQLLAETAEAAHAAGRWAGVCGEMAGDPLAIPLLIGLGFDELSMTPGRIPAAKERIRNLDYSRCLDVARQALELASAGEVASLAEAHLPAP